MRRQYFSIYCVEVFNDMVDGTSILASDAIIHCLEVGFVGCSCDLLDQSALHSYDFMEDAKMDLQS